MAKISLLLAVLFCGTFSATALADSATNPVKIYSFSVHDSSIVMKQSGRMFSCFVDKYEGQTLMRFYLPGDMSMDKLFIRTEFEGMHVTVQAKAVLEKEGAVRSTKIFFSLDCLLNEYERQSFPGIVPIKTHPEFDIRDILTNAKNWQIISQ
jgi:hypothetical protein